jgi:hypothetical protein
VLQLSFRLCETQLNVNVVGSARVAKAVLPLIVQVFVCGLKARKHVHQK